MAIERVCVPIAEHKSIFYIVYKKNEKKIAKERVYPPSLSIKGFRTGIYHLDGHAFWGAQLLSTFSKQFNGSPG